MSNEIEKDELPGLSRRGFLGTSALVAAGATIGSGLSMPHVARAQSSTPAAERRFAFSTPFSGQDSFSGQIGGLNAAMADLGGELTIADAQFDLRRQNDQIQALAASQPDALLILPVDPVGCSNAIQAAVDADVPVFLMDSYAPFTTAVSVSMPNSFGLGEITAKYMVDRLGGQGKIAAMQLPINEAWNMRDMAMDHVLREHPDIEVVATWAFDPTGRVTPRAAADSFLAAHADLDAIWCAWDNAAMEAALAVLAAGRQEEIFTTGIDGGPAAFEMIKADTPFAFSGAQSFYTQAYNLALFAHQHLDGEPVPRIVINPGWGVDKAMLDAADPDLLARYDQPGVSDQLGWPRQL